LDTKKLLAAGAATLGLVVFEAPAQQPAGYLYSVPSGVSAKNSFGQCWRASYWTPAMATMECDPDLVPKPAPVVTPPPPPPAAKPAPAPLAKPAAPAPLAKPAAPPKPRVITVNMTGLFDENRATLTPAARARLDKEVVAAMGQLASVDFVHIEGHTDRLGSAQYNQKLSERRADAVAAYLVSKGLDRNKVGTLGMGKTNPVKACPDQKNRKALIECLAPNRRVVVEIKGMPK
jgi:OOP family OmpA-OmpF porin